MRRPLWLRTMIAVWAVWLGATLVAPVELQPCPVHGNHASHSMAGMSGMQEHAAHQGAPSHKRGDQCTCVGACCCAAPVAPLTTQVAEVTIAEPLVIADLASIARDERSPVVAPPHSLPFANGPPAQA